jgi:phosphoribosylamine---glycine ligase
MRVLILGSGGREHALGWKFAQSPLCSALFFGPGNGGTSDLGTNITMDISDEESVIAHIQEHQIDLVVVGPEAPLVDGLCDFLWLRGVAAIGCSEAAAQLEGSKVFAKDFMTRHNIPTAKYQSFTKQHTSEAIAFLESVQYPIVIKADGLAAGKGVEICQNISEAINTIQGMLVSLKHGKAGHQIVIEEFLVGKEISLILLTDGQQYVAFPPARDYKRAFDSDKGPNTGGMGVIAPVPEWNPDLEQRIRELVILPTLTGIRSEQLTYKGFLFIGLMINAQGNPYVLEYNVRSGDPETQTILTLLDVDLLEVLSDLAYHTFNPSIWKVADSHAVTVVLASEGYPGKYKTGYVIHGLDQATSMIPADDPSRALHVFHAGTVHVHDDYHNAGGRVLAVTAKADSLVQAREIAYQAADTIEFEGKIHRNDIGL